MSISRRGFLEKGMLSLTATALLAGIDQVAAANPFINNDKKDMDLKILATNWGYNGSLDEYCSKAKQEGYDGIEIWWPTDDKDRHDLFAALKKHNLEVGFLCGNGETNYKKHLESFRTMVGAAVLQKQQRPLYINCHSGRDHFSFEQNSAFVEFTIALEKQTGIRICHETHRSRIMFAAHVTKQFIEKFPALHLTLDISHWCNVHESMLQDQEAAVNLALKRTEHIHARIGHPEGPQVNDPRAPEWEKVVAQHLKWWDVIVERKKIENTPVTFLTEFGPPDYMPTEPYTRKPLADQWAINLHMMKLLRQRYQS